MMIDKIGGISPNYGPKKSTPVSKKEGQAKTDSVQISAEATRAAELAQTVKLVKATPDTSRQEKLQEVKDRLARGEYDQLSDTQLSEMADSIGQTLLGQA